MFFSDQLLQLQEQPAALALGSCCSTTPKAVPTSPLPGWPPLRQYACLPREPGGHVAHASTPTHAYGRDQRAVRCVCHVRCTTLYYLPAPRAQVTALAQGLADTLVFREGEEGVALLGARLRAIGAAAFNSRLGGQAGDVCVATWRQHASAPGFKGQRGKVGQGWHDCLALGWWVAGAKQVVGKGSYVGAGCSFMQSALGRLRWRETGTGIRAQCVVKEGGLRSWQESELSTALHQ